MRHVMKYTQSMINNTASDGMNGPDVSGIRAGKMTSTSSADPSRDLCEPAAGLVVPPARVVCLDIDVFQYFSKQRFQLSCWCANTVVLVYVISSQAFSWCAYVCVSVCGRIGGFGAKRAFHYQGIFEAQLPTLRCNASRVVSSSMISSGN